MFVNRPYQDEALDAISRGFFERRLYRQAVVLPTGCGKTIVFAGLPGKFAGWFAQFPQEHRKAFVVAHREELIEQAAEKLQRANPDLHVEIEQAARHASLSADIVVASVPTLASRGGRRMDRFPVDSFRLVIVDEFHHAIADSYTRVLQRFGLLPPDDWRPLRRARSSAKALEQQRSRLEAWDTIHPLDRLMVGVTATIRRGDNVGLEAVAQEIVYEKSIREMAEAGYLCRLRGLRVCSSACLDSIRTRAGDFALNELAEMVDTDSRNQLAVHAYLQHAPRRKAVVFCTLVEHARHMAAAFRAAGIPAALVHGDMGSDERRRVLGEFRAGAIRVLTNVGVLTEGWDEPSVDCIIHARPTKSPLLYVQMTGRGTRLAPGKGDCLVIDITDNSRRHDVCAFPELVGLPARFDSRGEEMLTLASTVEDLKRRHPLVDFSRAHSVAEMRLAIEEFDVLAGRDPRVAAVLAHLHAAEAGDAAAQFTVALAYANGSGVRRDRAEALRWYRLAAEQGHSDALNNLGVMYLKGHGMPRDPREAARWYKEAAARGNPIAQHNLGSSYANGSGLKQDFSEAYFWLNLATALTPDSRQEYAADRDRCAGRITLRSVLNEQQKSRRWMAEFKGRTAAGDGTGSSACDPLLRDFSLAEEGRDPRAQFRLGLRYAEGSGVPQDYEEAIKWYRLAAEGGNADAQNNLAVLLRACKGMLGDPSDSVQWYRRAADQGEAVAMWNLGRLYEDGAGIERDRVQAYFWFNLACARLRNEPTRDYVAARDRVLSQLTPAQIAKSQEEASRWWAEFKKAKGIGRWCSPRLEYAFESARQGMASGQASLGLAYHEGDGVVQDYSHALSWYLKAAQQGDPSAENSLGLMHAKGEGVPTNPTEAAHWYRRAAQRGLPRAQANLAHLYRNGIGVPQSASDAYFWLILASAGATGLERTALVTSRDALLPELTPGTIEEAQGLARQWTEAHPRRIGCATHEAETAQRYRRDAEAGDVIAQYNLGVVYHNGEGVPQDYQEAFKWYRAAADRDYASAQNNLGVLHEHGCGRMRDAAEATRWYRMAAEQGDAMGQYNLGRRYANGAGVRKDLREAARWLGKAAGQGHSGAVEELTRLRIGV